MNSLFRCQLCCESRIEHENVSCAAMTTSNINPLLDIFIECRMWNEKERKLIFKHFYSSSHISSPFIRPTSSHEVTVPLLSPSQQENEKTFRTVVSHRVKTWITSTIFLYYCCACLYSFTYSFSHQVISTTPPQLKTQFLALLPSYAYTTTWRRRASTFCHRELTWGNIWSLFYSLHFLISSSSSWIYFKFLNRKTYMKIEIEAEEMRWDK